MDENHKTIIFPLDIQVAREMVKKHKIWLVKDVETGKRIPYFYNINRFVEDEFFYNIRGFVKNELLDIFNFTLNQDSFASMPERCNDLIKYNISDSDFEKFQNNPGYLNILTKHVVKNIIDSSELVKEESEFDSESTLVNTQNGILDLVSGELLKHTPDKLIRNIVNACYIVPSNEMETNMIDSENNTGVSLFYKIISDALFDKTKSEIENKEIISSFIEVLASFLIGNNEHKLVYIIIGEPDTGKSTLIEILLEILGSYSTTFNNSALMVSS